MTGIEPVSLAWKARVLPLHNTRAGIGYFSYNDGPQHHIFEIWRVGNLAANP